MPTAWDNIVINLLLPKRTNNCYDFYLYNACSLKKRFPNVEIFSTQIWKRKLVFNATTLQMRKQTGRKEKPGRKCSKFKYRTLFPILSTFFVAYLLGGCNILAPGSMQGSILVGFEGAYAVLGI